MNQMKIAIFSLCLFTSFNLFANETNQELSSESIDKCEATYSSCMQSCEAKEGEALESCYDKCDESYSKCLEEIQSN
ncbi:MAG: hypothetical protein IE909_02715 [Campylobacterales bacterium]|nr:hypothetical protein [Campylobacterales bacterium]